MLKKVFDKRLFVLFAVTSTLVACDLKGKDIGDTVHEENTLQLCSDNIDNDGNGLIDCQDPSCRESKVVSAVLCSVGKNGKLVENNDFLCSDGLDNDNNGYIDCVDNNCKKSQVCCRSSSPEDASADTCQDGIDNDCNGYIDCGDFACSKSSDPKIKEVCNKNCTQTGTENSNDLCANGIDDDCNGYADCVDNACRDTDVCKKVTLDVQIENDDKLCSDGIDNDYNGVADCDDRFCMGLGVCKKDVVREPAARTTTFSRAPVPGSLHYDEDLKTLKEYRKKVRKLEAEICQDGKDNDKNGLADCCDPKCWRLSHETLDPHLDDPAAPIVKCPKDFSMDTCLQNFWPKPKTDNKPATH